MPNHPAPFPEPTGPAPLWMARFLSILGAVLLAMPLLVGPLLAKTRIDWDAGTRKFACAGTYGRAKKLGSGDLALVYSSGTDVWIRKSGDGGRNWGTGIRVAHDDGYANTNAEMAELRNGWLVYGWNGRPQAGGPYFIGTKISKDGGLTWGAEARAYTGGPDAGTGCWEPAFLQLPGGELQLYFANESPYPGTSADQEIGMLRSLDNGGTWGSYLAVSHRAGSRDGMPVPVLLKDGGIAVAIEDNGLSGSFKPAIIHSPAGMGWGGTPVGGKDPRRWGALAQEAVLAPSIYAGAPYMVRLPSGETVLSIQSGEGRDPGTSPTAHPIMQVYVGTAEAGSFSGKTTPFPDIPAVGNGLWNSLLAIDDSTVMAVSSVAGMGNNGVWTVIGRVLRDTGQTSIFRHPQGGRKHPQIASGRDGNNGWQYLGFDVRGRSWGREAEVRATVTRKLH
ncbi:MAG: hypothetical protein JWP91_3094 [Fibrobacteres bacterium]|nr:hypothetical protein [Fibrobacterota bacterium]